MKAENKLAVLNRFMEAFQNEIDFEENTEFFKGLQKELSKEIIICKYDNPVYVSKAGTTILLKPMDSIEIGSYIAEGPNAIVIDSGLSKEDALALGEKIVLTELKGIVGFKESNYNYEAAAPDNEVVNLDKTPELKFDKEPKDVEYFSCACGHAVGKMNIGKICKICETEVIKSKPIDKSKEEVITDITPKNVKSGDATPSEEQDKKEKKKQDDAALARSIVDTIIGESNSEVTYKDGKAVDPNGVIIDEDKEDYYSIRVLTEDDRFISPDIDDYNNNYTMLMEESNPIFLVDNGKYVHIRGYNTVEETERLAIAEEKRQNELLGGLNEIIEDVEVVDEIEEESAFGNKNISIVGREEVKVGLGDGAQKIKLNLGKGISSGVGETKAKQGLRIKSGMGESKELEIGTPRFRLGEVVEKNENTGVTGGTSKSIFGQVRTVGDLDI